MREDVKKNVLEKEKERKKLSYTRRQRSTDWETDQQPPEGKTEEKVAARQSHRIGKRLQNPSNVDATN